MNNVTESYYLDSNLTISLLIVYSFLSISGNFVVIYVMTRPKFLKISLFRFLAVASFLSILKTTFWILNSFQDPLGINSSSFNCKIFYYFCYLPYQCITWIVVWTGIDRYLSVKYPKKFLVRNKTKFQAFTILIIVVFHLLNNVPILFLFDIVSNNCQMISYSFGIVVVIENGFFGTALPGLSMIILSWMIYRLLIGSKNKIGANKKKEIRLFKTLTSIYSLNLICNLPYYISYVTVCILQVNFEATVFWPIMQYVSSSYSSLDFFIYFMTNRLFREHCLKTFGIKCFFLKPKEKNNGRMINNEKQIGK